MAAMWIQFQGGLPRGHKFIVGGPSFDVNFKLSSFGGLDDETAHMETHQTKIWLFWLYIFLDPDPEDPMEKLAAQLLQHEAEVKADVEAKYRLLEVLNYPSYIHTAPLPEQNSLRTESI